MGAPSGKEATTLCICAVWPAIGQPHELEHEHEHEHEWWKGANQRIWGTSINGLGNFAFVCLESLQRSRHSVFKVSGLKITQMASTPPRGELRGLKRRAVPRASHSQPNEPRKFDYLLDRMIAFFLRRVW
jgi:hypothetical protein